MAQILTRTHRWTSSARFRALVLVLAFLVMVIKLRIAATTIGTNDARAWPVFAAGVRAFGPINIYSVHTYHAFVAGVHSFYPIDIKGLPRYFPYNHPPMIGWLLVLVNNLASHGFGIRYLMRVPAIVADMFTALLVFEILRSRRRVAEAALAAALVAVSPVLISISGFHGNTDPVFVLFVLLAAYLLADRHKPLLAGIAFAVSVGIKLVPIVALPTLLVAAAQLGRRRLAGFIGGVAVGMLPVWAPVLLRQWHGFATQVLGYGGTQASQTQWGLVDLAQHLHSTRAVDFLIGPGRYILLFICAAVPALLCARRKSVVVECVALSLAMFLLLAPTFGVQYLAWVVAALYLFNVRAATAYNLIAGCFLVRTYTIWSGGFPWNYALSHRLDGTGDLLGWAAWGSLLASILLGAWMIWRTPNHSQSLPDPEVEIAFRNPPPELAPL